MSSAARSDTFSFRGDAAQLTVTNTNDSGSGSLRQALLDACANPDTDTISFAIPGSNPYTIRPTSALPTITDPVIIIGYTQPGVSHNTNPIDQGSSAVVMIELDGRNACANVDGLTISAANSMVRGLAINRFGTGWFYGSDIYLHTKGGNFIEGNFLGTDVTGTTACGNLTRSVRTYSGNNIIRANIIFGNHERGVFVLDNDASRNEISYNDIGTNASATAALGNGVGAVIHSVSENIVWQNVISGNGFWGIEIVQTPTVMFVDIINSRKTRS